MNCSDFNSWVIEYLDRRLTPERAAEADAHLQSCSSCRGEAEAHRRTWDLVHRIGAIEPSAGFGAAVRRRARRPGLPALFASCAAAAALVVAVFLMRGTPAAETDAGIGRLAPEDRRLLEELSRDRTWELADNMDLARAFELLEGNAAPEEDH